MEEELLEQEEEDRLAQGSDEISRRADDGDEEHTTDNYLENIDENFIDGVPRNAYLLWESLPRRANRLRTLRYQRDLRRCGKWHGNANDRELEFVLLPESYQSHVALNTFQTWQVAVRANAFPGGIDNRSGGGVLDALFRRFPALQQILSILVGVIPPIIANDPYLSWSESLLMELLYSRPDIMPENIALRANVAMSRGGANKHNLEEIILSVMNGSAGQVVETMFSLLGGSSGAALPATVVSRID